LIEAIEKVARQFDRESAQWVTLWLSAFFVTTNLQSTLKAHSMIHSDFGSNPTYVKYKEFLRPLCAHAIESYAEGVVLTQSQETAEAGAMGMLQVVEPIVLLARLTGVKDVRPMLVNMAGEK
jgi:hypothetical protein